jgi:TonB-linked outer membrane protein, SusC/RagA family
MKNLSLFHNKLWKNITRLSTLAVLFLFIGVPNSYANSNGINETQQSKVVQGTITDEAGEPLIGVNITVKGTSNGTISNLDGNYTITVSGSNPVLVYTYIGYKPQEVAVGSRSQIDVTLHFDNQTLEEVVVVGYGVQKKKLITGATVQVKGDDIQKLNTVNAIDAMKSQSPGLNITQSSGMPGEKPKVIIRGIGTNGSYAPLYVIDGSPGGDISTLNPGDIESIDVLKDAASAAIYGSRAANGVILVTTKQGRSGKPQISFDGYYGIQNIYRMPDLLNAQEYATIMTESRLMDGLPDYNYEKDVPAWDKIKSGAWKGTNWMDEGRNKDAAMQNYTLNIAGGTDQSTYSLGFSYTSQDGIIGKPAPNYDRYTARVNTEYTLYKKGALDVIKLGETLTYSYTQNNGIAIGDMWYNDVRNMLKTPPFLPLYDENGELHKSIPWDVRTANPIAQMDTRSHNISKNHNMKANVFLTIQPIKGLTFRSNFGYTLNAGSYRNYTPEYDLSSTVKNTTASVSQSMWTGIGLTLENTLTYVFSIDKHNFNALVGQSLEKNSIGENLNAANGNPIFHDLDHAYIDNAKLTSINSATAMGGSPWGENKLASFFGRINYDYNNKYMATVILRADGSSKFRRGERWGYFPSVSAGWVVTSEPFMESISHVMDFLKIRASWGQNGNQDVPGFQYLATIKDGVNYTFGNDKFTPSNGFYPDKLPNLYLSWETSEQTNIGIDARFLNSRLGLTFDYYIKKTKDWIVLAPQLASFGTGAPYINGGDIENKGFEIALNWNDQIGSFRYGAGVNLAHNKNKVTRIDNSEGILHGTIDALFQGSTECYRGEVGFPLGYFYGYKTAGVFQSQEEVDNYKGPKLPGAKEGDLIWVDRDNSGKIDENDRGMIGNPHPDYILGINLNAAYKGFDINLAMNGVFGNQIMKSYRSWSDSPQDNHTSQIFGRWHGIGTSNKLPRLTTNSHSNWNYVSDIYVEDGDYLRMQNITIGYDFKKLFPRMPLQQARLYISAQNLFTITGYSGMDPDVGYGHTSSWSSGIDCGFYPSPRTYLVGVNLKF